MKNGFSRQTDEFLRVASDVRVPESVQAFAEDSVTKTRQAYQQITAAARDAQQAMHEVAGTANAGAKTLGEKVLANVTANTEAAFDAAVQIARSKTLPEAVRLQTEFLQSQLSKASEQTREFYELSSKIAQQTFSSWNEVASRTFNQTKAGQ
jgi:phasin